MAAIKSYSDLQQSKKLAEILPLESADFCYIKTGVTSDNRIGVPEYQFKPMPHKDYSGESIGCWSLAALLSVIPNYKLSSEHNYHTCIAETSFGKETVAWFDNSVDACVAMIEKLNELNLL